MPAGRAIISALALWLAFSGVAAAEQLYVNESGWWRVDGAFNVSETSIQAAVDAAGEGDAIYVWNGSYYENVDVDKRLTLEGEGADVVTVTAVDTGDNVFEVTANYVNISGFAVRGATDRYMAGVYLDNADYCNISGNDVYGNSYGIFLSSSSNNTLTSNTASSNNNYGITLSSSSSNTLTSNTANSNNYHGIYLDNADDNDITCNLVQGNGHGFYFTSGNTGNNVSYNSIIENGNYNATSGGWEWQFYTDQYQPVEAKCM